MIKSDLVGMKFGRLTVLRKHDKTNSGHLRWLCECECGNKTIVYGICLKRGTTKSCGCYKRDRVIETHKTVRAENETLYNVWIGMKQRCNNQNNSHYYRYGARGIRLCDEWNNNYESFYEWAVNNGYEYGKQIDRKDNDKGYYPENCRFVTQTENANNKSTTIRCSINGEERPLKELCKEYNINYYTVYSRIFRLKWDIEKALTTPPRKSISY